MGRPDYLFGQFRETARCRDAQHRGGVCCALLLSSTINKQLKLNLDYKLQ